MAAYGCTGGRITMPRRPHLLLITTDQQRGDCLGIYGHPVLSTPNFDYLGLEGGLFLHAYAEAPSCVPARRTIMSGLTPCRHGMVGYRDGVAWDPLHTLPGELSAAGYQTQLVGKLHLWPPRRRYGFDHMVLADGPHGDNDYVDWLRRSGHDTPDAAMAHGVSGNAWVGRPSHLPESLHHGTWCVDEALRFLDRRDPSDPFFLWVSFHAPHPPLTPPDFYYDRYMHLDLPEPVIGDWAPNVPGPSVVFDPNASRIHLTPEAMRRCRAAYYGLINHIDDQVGRLIEGLRRRGLYRDTLIAMTSDHGEMLGDHHLFRKTFAYEASAHVPLLLRAPDWMGGRRNLRIDQVAGLADIMPTLLDAAGVDVPPEVDGKSLLPLVRGETPPWRPYLHGEHSACYGPDDGMQYLTDGHEKYVWYTASGREHLFDLDRDPRELHDRSADREAADRLELWRSRLAEVLRDRPEGFSDGRRLIPGRKASTILPPTP